MGRLFGASTPIPRITVAVAGADRQHAPLVANAQEQTLRAVVQAGAARWGDALAGQMEVVQIGHGGDASAWLHLGSELDPGWRPTIIPQKNYSLAAFVDEFTDRIRRSQPLFRRRKIERALLLLLLASDSREDNDELVEIMIRSHEKLRLVPVLMFDDDLGVARWKSAWSKAGRLGLSPVIRASLDIVAVGALIDGRALPSGPPVATVVKEAQGGVPIATGQEGTEALPPEPQAVAETATTPLETVIAEDPPPEDIGVHCQQKDDHWHVLGASVRGRSHEAKGGRREDAFEFQSDRDCLVIIVCDGAGSAPRGFEGARLCAQMLTRKLVDRRFPDWVGDENIRLRRAIEDGIMEVREACRALGGPSVPLSSFHATLVGLHLTPTAGAFFHIGDGVAAALSTRPSLHTLGVSKPENGNSSSETVFFTSTVWRDRLRITPCPPADLYMLMTDGAAAFTAPGPDAQPNLEIVEDLFGGLFGSGGEDADRLLTEVLNDPRLDKVTRDDKTLVMVQRVPISPPETAA